MSTSFDDAGQHLADEAQSKFSVSSSSSSSSGVNGDAAQSKSHDVPLQSVPSESSGSSVDRRTAAPQTTSLHTSRPTAQGFGSGGGGPPPRFAADPAAGTASAAASGGPSSRSRPGMNATGGPPGQRTASGGPPSAGAGGPPTRSNLYEMTRQAGTARLPPSLQARLAAVSTV